MKTIIKKINKTLDPFLSLFEGGWWGLLICIIPIALIFIAERLVLPYFLLLATIFFVCAMCDDSVNH